MKGIDFSLITIICKSLVTNEWEEAKNNNQRLRIFKTNPRNHRAISGIGIITMH